MNKVLKTVKCDSCNNIYTTNIIAEIRLPADRSIMSKVKDFTIYNSTCPFCNRINLIYYPINIIDVKRKFALLTNEKLEKNYKDYKIRIVNNGMELVEKYHIFTQHLDEQVMETIGATLLKKFKEESDSKNVKYFYCNGRQDNIIKFSNPMLDHSISVDYNASIRLKNILEKRNILIQKEKIPKTKEQLFEVVEDTIGIKDLEE